MRSSSPANLCCPACRGALELEGASEDERGEVLTGELVCQACGARHRIVGGIPVLLPADLPNPGEQEVRRRVSEEAARAIEGWRDAYDRHHLRARMELELEAFIERRRSARPRILDVGVGWGVGYLPFATRAELWGIDFSLESLLLARRIFEAEGAPVPELVCASLDAIPIAGLGFDLVRSTQVYQHIADESVIRRSFGQIVGELLADGGEFVVENLNHRYARLAGRLRQMARRGSFEREHHTDDFYLRYYRPEDFRALFAEIGEPRISYSEVVLHPELRMVPRSRGAARLDMALSRLPGASLLSRQVGAVVVAGGR